MLLAPCEEPFIGLEGGTGGAAEVLDGLKGREDPRPNAPIMPLFARLDMGRLDELTFWPTEAGRICRSANWPYVCLSSCESRCGRFAGLAKEARSSLPRSGLICSPDGTDLDAAEACIAPDEV